MYKIGELSKLCRLSVKTLRFYDSEGLLVPDEIDRYTGYRYYSASKLIDCYTIIAFKELGYSLDEIKKHMNAVGKKDILSLMESKYAQLEAKKSEIETRIRRIDMIKRRMMEENSNMYNIVVRGGSMLRVAANRKFYASKNEAEEEIKAIREALPKNICGDKNIIINYETEYREDEIDLAACCEITSPLPAESGYTEIQLEFSENTVSLACRREEVDDGYETLFRYINESDYQIIGAACEIYYDKETMEIRIPVCGKIQCEGSDLNVGLGTDVNAGVNIAVSNVVDTAANAVINTGTFENDAEAVGKWKLVDIVPSREQFIYGHPKFSHMEEIMLNELYFLKGGEPYWIVEGWTKGKIYVSAEFPTRHKVTEKYTIENISGHKVLFWETNQIFPDGSKWAVPQLRVYVKVSDREYTARDIQIRDKTDYDFMPDYEAVGKWDVYDFMADNIEKFNPDIRNRNRDMLYLRSVEFAENGSCVYTVKGGRAEHQWTKGFVLNRRRETASAYRIKKMNGREYMLLEWKSGDYTYSGRVNWYILVH